MPTQLFPAAKARLKGWEKPLKYGWLALIAAYVVYKLTDIGWAQVLAGIPSTPFFYLIYALSFMVLPFSEKRVYSLIWQVRIGIVPFLRKRSLNNVVLGYSGDVYFYLWARRRLGLPDRRLIAGIKDANLLSGIAGTIATAGLVTAFAFAGPGALLDRVLHEHFVAAVTLGVIGALLVPLAYRFRRTIFWIDPGRAGRVFAIHFARVLAVLALQALQWTAAIPQAPLETWLLFLTLQMLVGQLPLVPNRDLLFLALGLELMAGTGVDEAQLSGLLVATALLKQATNLVTLLLTSFETTPAEASDEAEGENKQETPNAPLAGPQSGAMLPPANKRDF